MKSAPSSKNLPNNINPEATDLWKDVCYHYSDSIYEPKSVANQWNVAKSHFERKCRIEGITPYNKLEAWASALEKIARGL